MPLSAKFSTLRIGQVCPGNNWLLWVYSRNSKCRLAKWVSWGASGLPSPWIIESGTLQCLWSCLSSSKFISERQCLSFVRSKRLLGQARCSSFWRAAIFHGLDSKLFEEADVFVAVGTSGEVYPAASFSRLCKNAIKININPAEAGHIENSSYFHFHISKKSTEALPALLEVLTLTIKESASCREENLVLPD